MTEIPLFVNLACGDALWIPDHLPVLAIVPVVLGSAAMFAEFFDRVAPFQPQFQFVGLARSLVHTRTHAHMRLNQEIGQGGRVC